MRILYSVLVLFMINWSLGLCAGKRGRDVRFSWREAALLAHTSGSEWAYQPSPSNDLKIAAGLSDLGVAWQKDSADKTLRPVFTVASGPGTGKSRLLDELPALCRTLAVSNPALQALLGSAHIFKVSFENGTPFDPDTEAGRGGDTAVGTRMMWQLADKDKFGRRFSAFISLYHYTIDDALEALSEITGVKRNEQVIFLLVDGLQRLILVQSPGMLGAAYADPVFRSAVNAVSACVNSGPERVVGAISATLTLPIEAVFGSTAAVGSQQIRIYLQPPPLTHPESVVPDVDGMPLLHVLRDDMGGHGRALEILGKHLHAPDGTLRPFSTVAQDVISEISTQYRSWTIAGGIQSLLEPLLYAVVARRKLRLSDLVPGCADWTVDKACGLGLVRHVTTEPGESAHLDIAVILLHVIRRELKPGPLFSLIPDYAFIDSPDRASKTWQDFEDFVANFRAIKVAAFRDKADVLLSELHTGATLSAAAANTRVRVPIISDAACDVRIIHSIRRCQTSAVQLDSGTGTFKVDGRKVEGRAGEGIASSTDVVLNGISASAGDIFLRLDLADRDSSNFIPVLEVIACRRRTRPVNALDFDTELEKALGAGTKTMFSFFLFVSTSRVNVDLGDSAFVEPATHSGSAGAMTRSIEVDLLGFVRFVFADLTDPLYFVRVE